MDRGSAEWLAAYDALQADLTDSNARPWFAQAADLQAQNGTIQSVYRATQHPLKKPRRESTRPTLPSLPATVRRL